MLRLSQCTVTLSLLAFLAAFSAPPLLAQASTVRCESAGRSIQQCPIPSGSTVELVRTLSQEACRKGHNWDVAAEFVWVSNGCRAEFTVTPASYGPGYGNAEANRNQLRACRSEADRRMAKYSYEQIEVEGESRQGNVAYVRWRAGSSTGLCAVAANGRIIQFTTDAAGGGAGYPGATTMVLCESRQTERQECRIPTGARVRLVRQLSQNACRLNDTYGQAASYIWVAEGCRGEFEVRTGGGYTPGTERVVCASSLNSRRQCAIPHGARVRLVRQMSEVTCRSTQNWGVGPDFIWVTRGCSGEFEVTSQGGVGDGGGNVGPATRRIVCESRGTARELCQVTGASAVKVVKQLSTNPCRLNQSFGVAFGAIWVSNGCRAEFEVTIGGSPTGPGGVVVGGDSGTGLPNRVVCESKGGERTECRIKVGAEVRLARQLSTTACTQNSTWGYGYGLLWVTKGCRGEFEVK